MKWLCLSSPGRASQGNELRCISMCMMKEQCPARFYDVLVISGSPLLCPIIWTGFSFVSCIIHNLGGYLSYYIEGVPGMCHKPTRWALEYTLNRSLRA